MPRPIAAGDADGHLSVHVDGQHPSEIPFLFERARVAPAAVVSTLSHAIFAAAMIFLLRGHAQDSTPSSSSHDWRPPLRWVDVAGHGGGGGGGGDNHPGPPRRAERPGHDAMTVPVAQERSLETPRTIRDAEPIEGVIIPARSLADMQSSLPGAIEAPAVPTTSRGPGSGSGAGDNSGSGIGSGRGAGYGPGTDRNTGGGPYRPGAGITSPRVLREVKPQYTSDAMRAKVQGTVLLACASGPMARSATCTSSDRSTRHSASTSRRSARCGNGSSRRACGWANRSPSRSLSS
jgi:protein TonB